MTSKTIKNEFSQFSETFSQLTKLPASFKVKYQFIQSNMERRECPRIGRCQLKSVIR